MHKISDAKIDLIPKCAAFFMAVLTIMVCILPMDDLPIWNGEIPAHRNQYELMAEAILNGRIDFAYGDEAELEVLENPYDPIAREESGVTYHWDHAYYNGHYYMYFGVVPVLLVFLPYRLVTGEALTTFHATQLFTAVIIAGIVTLFWMLWKLFFRKMKLGAYLVLCVAFSVISVWNAAAEPALYCTAITAAIALEIWSIFFFIRAVYVEKRENRQILLAGVGALLGALVFGCRPPIGLANIIVLPLLAVFVKEHSITPKLVGKLALAALPYLLVAVSLMTYNYVRFDNPLEFGQAYQLTIADQSSYDLSVGTEDLLRILAWTVANFFLFAGVTDTFPYIEINGAFFNFPIFLACTLVMLSDIRKSAKRSKIWPILVGLVISVLAINVIDILWSPFLLERYRMDIYFLMGILSFMVFGVACEESQKPKLLSALIYLLSAEAVVCACLLFVKTVGASYPERVTEIAKMLGL